MRSLKSYVPAAILAASLSVLHLSGAFGFLEKAWLDQRFRWLERPAQGGVVLVEIDPASLGRLDVWPWPRGYHATVLESLLDAGASRVGFDIDFSSSSVAEEDAELVRAVAGSGGRVVLPVFRQWERSPEGISLATVAPFRELRRHARLAHINVVPDQDGLVRNYINRDRLDGRVVPGFAAALAGDPSPELDNFLIDFSIAPETLPRLSYVDVLTGQFDPSSVEGRVVIVGATAVELGDQIAVPVSAALAGPIVQSLAFESLQQGRALRKAPPLPVLGAGCLLVLLLVPVFDRLSWRYGLAMTAAVAAAMLVLSAVVQQSYPFLLPVVPPVLMVAGTYATALVRRIDTQALGLLTQRIRLMRAESRMRRVVESSFDAILVMNADGHVERVNRKAQEMFGLETADLRHVSLSDLLGGEDGHGLAPGSLSVDRPVEVTARRRPGILFPAEAVLAPLGASDSDGFVAFVRDITDRKTYERILEHRATHDALTDLPNRLFLQQRLQQTLLQARDNRERVALLLLDIDRFKHINDALGHATGDVLLQHIARRFQNRVREEDTIARLGGDEFAVLLPFTGVEEARATAARLMDALRQPFVVDHLTLQVDTSIGVAMYPDHADDGETLVQRADVAMYVAKEKGGGAEVYSVEQDYNSMRQLVLRGALREAIDHDQLSLAYQPKISAQTGQIVGAEALLRWTHPNHGFIPPDEFIGLAEHGGLIRELTAWVIETAVSQGSQWLREGRPVTLSVNLSARNLTEHGLPEFVADALTRHSLPPERLTFEITESVIMEDPERALRVVSDLCDLGVGISIDDFGTGYSSLSYLMRLPACELKIDRSFVMKMDSDPGNVTIVRSTIELAHNLGLEVVAEGVESQEIWNDLRELGCDIGQGYHFSRPLPRDQFVDWLTAAAVPATVPLAVAGIDVAPVG